MNGEKCMKLSELKAGAACVVESINDTGSVGRHLCDMGFLPNTNVAVTALAPLGDPMEVTLRGYRLTLRRSQADLVTVRSVDGRHAKWEK